MKKSAKDLVAAANAEIRTVGVEEAIRLVGAAECAFIDIRDEPELVRDGAVPGAVHVSRGMLEFCADPALPYHKEVFASGKQLLLYCASGGRSALATKTLGEMGYDRVAHVGGGFKAWIEAGGPIEPFRARA